MRFKLNFERLEMRDNPSGYGTGGDEQYNGSLPPVEPIEPPANPAPPPANPVDPTTDPQPGNPNG